MYNRIILVLCVISIVLGGLFSCALIRHNRQITKNAIELSEIENMPELKALAINGSEINLNERLSPEKRTVILFFSPDCEFCQQEIKGIISRYSECRNVQWVFFTLAQPEDISAFSDEYHIHDIPDSYIIREEWPGLYNKLNIKAPPELFIYDEHGKLMVHHKGATSIKTIVEELQ